MLGHAFDELGCVAVEFRTHFFNSTSRAAIERLGAKLDGMLRSHQLLPDGSRRDTVVYSILDVEWPSGAQQPAVPAGPLAARRARCTSASTVAPLKQRTDRKPARPRNHLPHNVCPNSTAGPSGAGNQRWAHCSAVISTGNNGAALLGELVASAAQTRAPHRR